MNAMLDRLGTRAVGRGHGLRLDVAYWPISTDASDVAEVGSWDTAEVLERHREAWAASCAPLGSRRAGGYEDGRVTNRA